MKLSHSLLMCLPLVLSGADAWAEEEHSTATLSLQVVTSCRITSTEDINFGEYDPLGVHASLGSMSQGRISVVCTNGTSNVSVSLYEGANAQAGSSCQSPRRAMQGPGEARLVYQIFQDPARTREWGCGPDNQLRLPAFDSSLNPVSLTTYGYLPPGQDASMGQYRDTVEVFVTF